MSKPLILVTNDDGITAHGIRALVECMQEIGEVVVVAPDSPQSAKGHAITISEPLRIHPVDKLFSEAKAFECSGTPVDCVKLAKHVILKDRKIDLCVSGINHGSNAAINIIYSGTLSAAMEATLDGIDAIGFSLLDFAADANFEPCKPFVKKISNYMLQFKNTKPTLLNVNFPIEDIQGIKVCRQAEARWKENFVEAKDPHGRPYYWLTGEFVNEDMGTDTDIWALQNGYVSVVPSMHDLTDYKTIDLIKDLVIGDW